MIHDYTIAEPIATSEEFKAALLATRDWIGITPAQLKMLQAQCRAPEGAITAAQIKEQLGLKSVTVARLAYGTFARAVAEKLGYAPPRSGKSPASWWFALSVGRSGVADRADGEYEWLMRPELAAALRSMKWA